MIVLLPPLRGRYRKLAELDPAGIVTEPMNAVPAAFTKTPAPVVDRFTVNGPVVSGEPPKLCRWMVISPESVNRLIVFGGVVNTSLGVVGSTVMVNVWRPLVSTPPLAVPPLSWTRTDTVAEPVALSADW